MSPAHYQNKNDRPARWGYIAAIIVAAVGHGAFFFLVLVIIPRLMKKAAPLAAYTVKVVDSIPAGDLGTHLPRLSQDRRHPDTPPRQPEKPKATPPPPPIPENPHEEAIALNSLHTTPTPTPRQTPRPKPTLAKPVPTSTPRPKRRLHKAEPTPTPTPTPRAARHRGRPAPTPSIELAKVEPTPGVQQRLEKVREQLLNEHLKNLKAEQENEAKGTKESRGGGPVLGSAETPGKGYGVGPGTGSAGIEQDPGFLVYYQQVQHKIQDAWSFAGGDPSLQATVTFGINPDGTLNSLKVTESSRDPAFDDSVARAIRRAAPFPPPPEKYRAQFADGLPAIFKLKDLNQARN
jgi:TonB family protein